MLMTESNEFTVLSGLGCRFCEIAAAVLDRVGRDHRVVLQRVHLDSDEDPELAAWHGSVSAPGRRSATDGSPSGGCAVDLECAARSPGDAPDAVANSGEPLFVLCSSPRRIGALAALLAVVLGTRAGTAPARGMTRSRVSTVAAGRPLPCAVGGRERVAGRFPGVVF